jgi:hypothetical protein
MVVERTPRAACGARGAGWIEKLGAAVGKYDVAPQFSLFDIAQAAWRRGVGQQPALVALTQPTAKVMYCGSRPYCMAGIEVMLLDGGHQSLGEFGIRREDRMPGVETGE